MKLYFQEMGEHQAEKIVFLHGFMGSGKDFSGLMQPLSKRFHCIAVDLPGHGKSLFEDGGSRSVPLSVADVGSLFLGQLADMGVRDFSLYGYSMGGRVAQDICLQAPDRINHLILESASFGIQDDTERRKRYRKDCELLSGVTSQAEFQRFLEKWHRLPLFCTLRKSPMLEDLIASKLKNDVGQLARSLSVLSVGNHRYFVPELGQIQVSMTYLFGEQDKKYKTMALETADAIPAMSLKGFPRASHNIHLPFPSAMISVLEEILI